MNYHIQFFLTRNCNQSCYYCSIFRDGITEEVNLTRLKYILDAGPSNVTVEMTGGEVGLIPNLDAVFKLIYGHRSVKRIIVMSNGLVRKNGVDWLDKVEYVEHLVKDIKGIDIIKFYDMNFDVNATNIIVATEITTKSILYNWDHFKNSEIMNDNFFIKLMNNKTHDIKKYTDQALSLFSLMGDNRQYKMVKCFLNKQLYVSQKKICSMNPPHTYIDFDDNVIGHCAVNFQGCDKKPFTIKNYDLLPSGELFSDCNYCTSCYSFDDGNDKAAYLIKSKKGDFMNRSYR